MAYFTGSIMFTSAVILSARNSRLLWSLSQYRMLLGITSFGCIIGTGFTNYENNW